MQILSSRMVFGLALIVVSALPAVAADIIVSAQDGKSFRDTGVCEYPEPAPPDSLVVIDASRSPPVVKGTLEGIEHTVQGPPQAVAVTPDGKLAIVAAPTRYDYAAKKELFDNFLQIVDIEASPPKLIAQSRRRRPPERTHDQPRRDAAPRGRA